MKHRVHLHTTSKNSKEVSKSLDVDNVRMEDLSIKTTYRDGSITTVVEANSIGTLLSTVDDVLRCQIAAESMIKE